MLQKGKVLLLGHLVALVFLHEPTLAAWVDPAVLDACPGYTATNINQKGSELSAELLLGPSPCNLFGADVKTLSLRVIYETNERIHVKISDSSSNRYEVPESVLPRPTRQDVTPEEALIGFNFTMSPFTFSIYRKSTQEILFSTASFPLIFEPQYLRIKTSLPTNTNLYGLGEHSNSFRLPTDNTTMTIWSRDSWGIPTGTNLYGNHPVYFEHRMTGTHGVFILNSDGMDIKITPDSLEYNVIGGILDFYFLAGSETDPTAVARQYAEVVGYPAEVPYWALGFHQCRFAYNNYIDVANVISRYAAANIPMETMWTDIDYMDRRRIFTVDSDYFPMARMREIVNYLHEHDQRYVLMTDPAVPYLPNSGYPPYDRGHELGVFLKMANGSESLSVVWPGVTVYPDWFNPKTQEFWTSEFQNFYSPDTGIDIDGAWIDMNEPTNFCDTLCNDPFKSARDQNMPPARTTTPPNPNTPIFTNTSGELTRRDLFIDPPYKINNENGPLSDHTAFTNLVHANGLIEYDTHNLFGTMMSAATRNALLARRPGKRPLIITRSTFAGAGAHVGKWLGDNFSRWDKYQVSIPGMLGFASIYQVPMVGSDICGFIFNTTEELCARWAMLGAFNPFMRNHNEDKAISQEFYVWPTVAQAARNAIGMRYRLMDYFYTAFHQAHVNGSPILNPLWFKYPKDNNTFGIQYQFFYGDSILVSPVLDEGSTSVSIYLPKDIFYDFLTLAPFQGTGSTMTLTNITLTQIPVHIKGGAILPLRISTAMTTSALRKTDLELVVAPDMRSAASGKLYFDDGESIIPEDTTEVEMSYGDGKLTVDGSFNYSLGVNINRVKFLGISAVPRVVSIDGKDVESTLVSYDSVNKVLVVTIGQPFVTGFELSFS